MNQIDILGFSHVRRAHLLSQIDFLGFSHDRPPTGQPFCMAGRHLVDVASCEKFQGPDGSALSGRVASASCRRQEDQK